MISITKNLDSYRQARAFALALPGAIRLKRLTPRLWRGNGMGHEPATYAALDRYGRETARVFGSGYGWRVCYVSGEKMGDILTHVHDERGVS